MKGGWRRGREEPEDEFEAEAFEEDLRREDFGPETRTDIAEPDVGDTDSDDRPVGSRDSRHT